MTRSPDGRAQSTAFAVRGEILHFTGDPVADGPAACHHHEDGVLVVRDGRVADAGDASALLPRLDPGIHEALDEQSFTV